MARTRLLRRLVATSAGSCLFFGLIIGENGVIERETFGQAFQEKHVQSVFIFNFTRYAEWPRAVFSRETNSFVIGVLGSDPIREHIVQVVANERAEDRPIAVRSYRRVQDIDACHILFISRSEAGQLESVLAALKGRSILTVSDQEGFARSGGMIQFRTERQRVRLTVNLEAVRAVGLNISSKLLRIVDVIGKPSSVE